MNFAVEDTPLPFDVIGVMSGKCTEMKLINGHLWFCSMSFHESGGHVYVRAHTD